jgi:purine-binding chemotaxis protein CheW
VALPERLTSLLRVRLGDTLIGLPAPAVQEVVRAVAITPLPGAPAIIEGAVNVRGQLVPVIDVRQRLSLPPRVLDPDQFLVILATAVRAVAIRVDDVDDIVDVDPTQGESSIELSPALQRMSGLAARSDGVIVIYDPDAFVSQAELEALDAALPAPA